VRAEIGRAADILVEAARGAAVLVVGHRGRGGLSSRVLGSVGLSCVLHAPCPVVVVPPAESPDARTSRQEGPPTVVVGMDGSAPATTAWRHAVEEAARRGARVLALAVVEPSEVYPFAGDVSPLPDAEVIRTAADARLGAAVDRLRAELPEELRAVPVTTETRVGRVARSLVEAARGADLLVIGHRGRGAAAVALLGSVGLGCVLHASCPVLVVPTPGNPEG
jgi:nucleotide-binding universal stress UspA family protein